MMNGVSPSEQRWNRADRYNARVTLKIGQGRQAMDCNQTSVCGMAFTAYELSRVSKGLDLVWIDSSFLVEPARACDPVARCEAVNTESKQDGRCREQRATGVFHNGRDLELLTRFFFNVNEDA